jgi:hypothetical protein
MKPKDIGMIILVIIGVIIYVINKIFPYLVIIAVGILTIFFICILIYYSLKVYTNYYFNSSKFKKIKSEIQNHINNCNELNLHIEELKNSFVEINSINYGLGNLNDRSTYNYNRPSWKNDSSNHKTYKCSSTIVNNANNQPVKYLCKYFNIEINEDSLEKFETTLNNFAAAEQGKVLLNNEKKSILTNIHFQIPTYIFNYKYDLLVQKLGFNVIDLSDLYFPTFSFQYTSPGGYSSINCDIKLNIENLDKLVVYINDLIKFRKSIKGQRLLMTSNLREYIKSRDFYSCQTCKNSTQNEKNLLLEIDHIIPLSKGGLTIEENLQTLCWKCNRSKGSKIL